MMWAKSSWANSGVTPYFAREIRTSFLLRGSLTILIIGLNLDQDLEDLSLLLLDSLIQFRG